MRVLVTGGAGYIGSHAVAELKRAGHTITIFDSFVRGHRNVAERLDVPIIEGDLCQEGDIDAALASGPFDAVMHFAAMALVSESMRDPGLYYAVNVSGGLRLLNAMRAHGCRRLIFSSTAAVYGQPESLPIREDSPLTPVNPYGRSKLAFEDMMRSYSAAYGLKALAIRYFNAAGAEAADGLGEFHHPETHLIPNLLRVALGVSKRAMIFGTDYDTEDGTCVRDFIHVSDLARVHSLALERLDGLGVEAINAGTGEGATVQSVVDAVREATGKPVPTIAAPRRAGDPPALVACPERAENLLGFRAERSLEDMVRSAWDFMRAHEDLYRAVQPRFGEAAVAAGLVTERQVQEALSEQQRRRDQDGEGVLLGLLMVELGMIKNNQLLGIMREMNARRT